MTRGTGCGAGCAVFISLIFYRGLTNQRGIRFPLPTDFARNVPRGTFGAEMRGLGSTNVPRGTLQPDQAWLERKLQAFPGLHLPSDLGFQVEVRSRPRTRPV